MVDKSWKKRDYFHVFGKWNEKSIKNLNTSSSSIWRGWARMANRKGIKSESPADLRPHRGFCHNQRFFFVLRNILADEIECRWDVSIIDGRRLCARTCADGLAVINGFSCFFNSLHSSVNSKHRINWNFCAKKVVCGRPDLLYYFRS